tara:strand:- start:799 stop:1527 length:729 start_codon:yes stop_codon:yes gene_type:complete
MINKNLLQSFISKYYLNGRFNAVKWRIEDNTLTVYAGESGRVCKIELNNFDLEDKEIGIFDTHKLSKLLSITTGELLLTLDSQGALSNKLNIADEGFDLSYSLSDPLVIPKTKWYKDPETWEIELELAPTDIDNLIKAKNALSDYDFLNIKSTKDTDNNLTSEFVFGDGSNYSNKITYRIGGIVDIAFLDQPMPFDSNLFKEILSANKDMDVAYFKLSSKGMAKFIFISDNINSTYYIGRQE